MSDPTETVLFREEKADGRTIGVIVLNNPRALNTLTLNMFHALEDRLLAWRVRDDLACVVRWHRPRPSVPVATLKHWQWRYSIQPA